MTDNIPRKPSLRPVANIVLALLLTAAAVYLLAAGTLFLPARWHPQTGTLFTGSSLYLLAAGLLALAAFAAAVARAWLRGDLPPPPQGSLRPPPDYKGLILVRYGYLVAAALACLIAAWLLARQVPNPALRNAPPPDAAAATAGASP